jgi:hypothetical protein
VVHPWTRVLGLFCAGLCLMAMVPANASAQAKTALIAGVPTSCAAAVELRNGELFARFSVAFSRYESAQARYETTIKLFERRLQQAEARWLEAAEQEKKRLVADLLIAAAGAGAAKYLPRVATDGLSKADEAMLKGAVERLEGAADVAVGAAFGEVEDARSIYIKLAYPLLIASATAFAPAVAPIAAAAAAIDKGAEILGRIFDVVILAYHAKAEMSSLSAALRQAVSRSPKAELQVLNQLKNSIDSSCGMK